MPVEGPGHNAAERQPSQWWLGAPTGLALRACNCLPTGVQLLADLREVFGASEKLASSTILERLRDLPESAWNDVRGKPLDQRGLS